MPGFVKAYPDAAAARRSLHRSAALRAQNVQTPAARPRPNPLETVFDLVNGTTGLPLVSCEIGTLLGTVAGLHACKVSGLRPFDPFLRIRPRLALATSPLIRAVLDEPVPQGAATLHGDLHAGQFIRDPEGTIWIVDLDDLSLGPPEADLANFAAHLSTSLSGGIAYWSSRVRTAWRGLSRPCDERTFRRYLRFALVRRHLKLREAGRPDFETEVVAYLRESSNFSIR